jgi:hypothetical protein
MRILLYNPDNGVTRNFMLICGCFSFRRLLPKATKFS